MRELSFVISNLIDTMVSKNATKEQIKKSCGEVIDGLILNTSYKNCNCDPVPLCDIEISYCPKCGFIFLG